MCFSFNNEMFNFCINKIFGKPLSISVFLKIFLSSFKKIIQEEDSSLVLEISVFYYGSFITEEAFTMEIEGATISLGCFSYVEMGNPSIFLVSIRTPKNGILLLILDTYVKSITELFEKYLVLC